MPLDYGYPPLRNIMRIPPPLRNQIFTFAFMFVTGQMRDLETLANLLEKLAVAARAELDSQP